MVEQYVSTSYFTKVKVVIPLCYKCCTFNMLHSWEYKSVIKIHQRYKKQHLSFWTMEREFRKKVFNNVVILNALRYLLLVSACKEVLIFYYIFLVANVFYNGINTFSFLTFYNTWYIIMCYGILVIFLCAIILKS